jgi:hypothetical protein
MWPAKSGCAPPFKYLLYYSKEECKVTRESEMAIKKNSAWHKLSV